MPLTLILHFSKNLIFSTKHFCLNSFPLHPLSLLSLGGCFGTSNCCLHCIRVTANFLFCVCVFVPFWFAYAKTKTPVTLQHMPFNILCLCANRACWAASYGFISIKRIAAILSGPMQCMQCREDFSLQLHICSSSYVSVPSSRNRKSIQ